MKRELKMYSRPMGLYRMGTIRFESFTRSGHKKWRVGRGVTSDSSGADLMENVVGRMELLWPTGIDILFLALCGLGSISRTDLDRRQNALGFHHPRAIEV